ncbi:glycosyltransferase family 2 protein [Parahaliea mediterranea]|uniref:glycosyltransferase family 2 protein n=1 Tax=Parahaliea mediterranea TaxID=651086 RepID=UPI000E2EF513|nr:glycosyltransferase family 2 protein [Parahaliea mediterranea]
MSLTTATMPTISSIVVTYHPKAEEFAPLLDALLQQTHRVIVVDNTPGEANPALGALLQQSISPERCQTIRFGENLGIATALNTGCEQAMSAGSDFVLLSDQDSLPAPNMVAELVKGYYACEQNTGDIAAVGPCYTDMHTELTYPFQVQKPGNLFYSHGWPTEDTPYIEALSLITSGTLIPAAILQKVGLMREDFFIDHVDTEWGMRARHLGLKLIGCGPARMYQRMGENAVRVWYFGWRNESLYSPTRLYYRLRNFVALLKDPRIDWRWKVRSSWYSLGLVYTHAVYGNRRWKLILHASQGIIEGTTANLGKKSEVKSTKTSSLEKNH